MIGKPGRTVMNVLERFIDEEGYSVIPVTDIANIIGVTDRYVRYGLKELIDEGLIEKYKYLSIRSKDDLDSSMNSGLANKNIYKIIIRLFEYDGNIAINSDTVSSEDGEGSAKIEKQNKKRGRKKEFVPEINVEVPVKSPVVVPSGNFPEGIKFLARQPYGNFPEGITVEYNKPYGNLPCGIIPSGNLDSFFYGNNIPHGIENGFFPEGNCINKSIPDENADMGCVILSHELDVINIDKSCSFFNSSSTISLNNRVVFVYTVSNNIQNQMKEKSEDSTCFLSSHFYFYNTEAFLKNNNIINNVSDLNSIENSDAEIEDVCVEVLDSVPDGVDDINNNFYLKNENVEEKKEKKTSAQKKEKKKSDGLPEGLYTEMVGIWNELLLSKLNYGVKECWEGKEKKEGLAMIMIAKKLVSFVEQERANGNSKIAPDNYTAVLKIWKFMLSRFDSWNPFYQKFELSMINKYFGEILTGLKSGNSKPGNKNDGKPVGFINLYNPHRNFDEGKMKQAMNIFMHGNDSENI